MNSTTGFSDGNTLYPVDPGFEFEVTVRALAFYQRNDALVAPRPSFCGFNHIDLEPFELGVLAVHAEQFSRKERRLIAAGPRADFEEQTLLVSRVFGNEQLLGLLFNFTLLLFECGALLRRHLVQFNPG